MSVYSLWFLCISFRTFLFTLITLELLIFWWTFMISKQMCLHFFLFSIFVFTLSSLMSSLMSFILLPYSHTFNPISFHFHFVDIFNSYPDWIIFYLVFSFGQHLLWWEVLFPFALWKCPPILLDKMLLFKMPFSKRALWIRAFCDVI